MIISLGFSLACRQPSKPAEAPSGPLVAFDLTEGAALFDAPFPGMHRMEGGHVRISDWPNPDGISYVETLIDIASGATGFGTTSGIHFRRVTPDTALQAVGLAESVAEDGLALLVALDGPEAGRRQPFDLWTDDDGGPFGAAGLVTLLPLQGIGLLPETTYAAVLRRGLGETAPLGVPAPLWAAARGEAPDGWAPEVVDGYRTAFDTLDAQGIDRFDIAAMTVFRTWDPTAQMRALTSAARAQPPLVPNAPLVVTEIYDSYCVMESTVTMPVYQSGEPPYSVSGGGWEVLADGSIAQQGEAVSRLWVTVPRQPAQAAGYPVAVMVRTGGGGDRPLIDRGLRESPGGQTVPGSGPAVQLAAEGYVGVQVDGPHGGPLRNPSGADEQFLMFNVANPIATRDNVRQSALELALLPGLLASLSLDTSGCPGALADVPLDLESIALIGHSMGATIAPLTLAVAPEFRAAVLSGAGGSYLYNLVYKRSPIEVRPIAEALLGFTERGRVLREDDAVLQLLQWASEPADPPPYAALSDADVLMVQGIVDSYILPPMANTMSLSYGLDLAGGALDAGHPELASMRSLGEVLPYGGGEVASLPRYPPQGPLRVVVQAAEDGIEDGHEVLFQTEGARHQYRCFLAGVSTDAPMVPLPGAESDSCD